jgi:hypothetical protein
MKNVCSNSADKNYGLYGGRGITFDQRWEKFTNFWADMGDEWEPGTRLKRNNTDGDFTAANCYWPPVSSGGSGSPTSSGRRSGMQHAS